jgi:hypothetical protein
MSVGIYSDPGPDHIARASVSRQMFWTLRMEQTDRWMESQTDGRAGAMDRKASGVAARKAARAGVP